MRISVLAAASLTLACGATAPPVSAPPQALATADELPTGASISEAYRFALRPTADWRPVSEGELAPLGGDAVAGGSYRTDGRGQGTVIVEAVGDMTLSAAADLTTLAFPEEERVVESRVPTRFLGLEAIRLVIVARVEGARVRWSNLLFLHQGHLYRLTSAGPRMDEAETASFFDTFVLLQGPVVRPPTPPTADATGPSWTLRDGRYQSLAADVEVHATERWRIAVGPELRELNPAATVGLVHSEPDVYAVVIAERSPPEVSEALLAYYRQSTEAELGPAIGTRSVTFRGAPIEARIHRANGFEFAHAVRCENGVCSQLLIWHVESLASAAQRALQDMPSFSPLTDTARAALTNELTAARQSQRSMGLGYAFRGPRYYDLAGGFSLGAPASSTWSIEPPESPGPIRFRDAPDGVEGMAWASPAEGPVDQDAFHAEVRLSQELAPSAATTVRVAGLEGRMSTGTRRLPFGDMTMIVLTATPEGRAMRWLFWGWPSLMTAARANIDAFLAELRIEPTTRPAVRLEGSTLVDEHAGLTFEVPDGTQHTDRTPPNVRGLSVVHQFESTGGGMVQVLALRIPGSEAQVRASVMNRLETSIGARVGERPLHGTTTMAGREALTARWDVATPTEIRVIASGGIGYAVITIGRRDMDAMATRLSLME